MNSKISPILLRTGLLALGLLVGCGGSVSHDGHDAESPSPTGGAAGDSPGAAGENATAGSGAAPSSGDSGTSGGGSENLGGGSQNVGGGSENLGGSAGDAGAPSFTLPPGCSARTPMETADLCSLAVDCDTAPSVRTYCHRLDSGQWECQCANQDSTYRVENVAGLQACALAARICSDTHPDLGAESCETTDETSGPNSCSTDVACEKPIDLGAATDAQAWLVRFGSASCNRAGAGNSFGCSCLNGLLASNYDVLVDSGTRACGPVVDFCMTGTTPTFDGKEACVPVSSGSRSDDCDSLEACSPTMPLTDGVSLAHLTSRSSNCVVRAGGGSECWCGEQDTAFSFRLSTPPDDASCASSILNCDPAAVITTTAAASCEPAYPDTNSGDMCQTFLLCTQAATIDNRSIVAEGSLGLICRRAGPGMPWVCSCASGQQTARVELGAAGANASQACTQASAACLDRLGLQLGPSGDPKDPPDPSL